LDGLVIHPCIPPCLTVTVDFPAAVDVDVGASNLDEARGVLEGVLEGIGQPIINIIGHDDFASDNYQVHVNTCYGPTDSDIHTDVDPLQKPDIHRFANGVYLIFVENNMTTRAAFAKGLEDVLGVISPISVGFDMASLVPCRGEWKSLESAMRCHRNPGTLEERFRLCMEGSRESQKLTDDRKKNGLTKHLELLSLNLFDLMEMCLVFDK
jgi:hypothetical protein